MSKKTIREVCQEGPFFEACVYDCLSARVVEEAGYKAMCLSGASMALAYCGLPDIGIVTPTEVAEMVRRITRCPNIPLIVDIDSGYGNELNLIRTCQMIADAGASAVHLEDQTFPKRTPTMPGFSLVDHDEWARRVDAAMYGLRGSDCMLIGRTDARVMYDIDETIARMKIATDLGAEATLAIGMYDEQEIARYMQEIPGYKMYEYLSMPGALGATKEQMSRTFQDCADLGFTIMSMPSVSLFGAMMGIRKCARSALDNGHDFDIIKSMLESGVDFPYFHKLTGRDKWLHWDQDLRH